MLILWEFTSPSPLYVRGLKGRTRGMQYGDNRHLDTVSCRYNERSVLVIKPEEGGVSFACTIQRSLRLDLNKLSVEEMLIKTVSLNSILVLLFSVTIFLIFAVFLRFLSSLSATGHHCSTSSALPIFVRTTGGRDLWNNHFGLSS